MLVLAEMISYDQLWPMWPWLLQHLENQTCLWDLELQGSGPILNPEKGFTLWLKQTCLHSQSEQTSGFEPRTTFLWSEEA